MPIACRAKSLDTRHGWRVAVDPAEEHNSSPASRGRTWLMAGKISRMKNYTIHTFALGRDHVSAPHTRLADHLGRGDDRVAGRAHGGLGASIGFGCPER